MPLLGPTAALAALLLVLLLNLEVQCETAVGAVVKLAMMAEFRGEKDKAPSEEMPLPASYRKHGKAIVGRTMHASEDSDL